MIARSISALRTIALTAICTAGALPLAAQSAGQETGWDPAAPEVTREELTQLLEQLETSASSSGYSGRIRQEAAREAEFVSQRLESGDFQVGDRVVLVVQGEPTLSDTLTVVTGQNIQVPEIGQISLAGVLRSELQHYLEQEIARYVQEPVIQTSALIRIAVLGAVRAQGFYTIPASSLLEHTLMQAGGPADNAEVDALEIHRGDRIIWEGPALQQALIDGRTLDQLSLRAGDRIVVPEEQPGLFEGGLIRTLLVAVPPAIYLVLRVIDGR